LYIGREEMGQLELINCETRDLLEAERAHHQTLALR
jgi:hypothetical protein